MILTKVFYTSAPNLVILAWMDQMFSRRQAQFDARTHTQTDAGDGNTRRAKLASGKMRHVVDKLQRVE